MNKKKKQHYVPKFYLKNFCINNKFYILLPDKNGVINKPVSYQNQCYGDYFYGEDEVWENKFANYERNWALSIRKIIEDVKLLQDDYNNIRKFIFYQKERTYGSNIYKTNQMHELQIEMLKMTYEKNKLSEKTILDILSKNRILKPSDYMDILEKNIYYVNDLKVLIIKYNTKLKLVSSDVPVIAINPFYRDALGAGSMGLVIFSPVCSNKLLVLYDAKMYKKYKGFDYIESDSEEEVQILNDFQFVSAEKIVFSESHLELLKFNNNSVMIRQKNRNQTGVASLGPGDKKMICYLPRSMNFSYELSFAELPDKIKKIPFNCRENLLRVGDEKLEEKLKNKIKILPMMIQKGILKEDDIGYSSREIKKGCKEMLRYAKKYWRK